MKICHMSSAHKENDIRIFIKESTSLAKKENHEVHYIVYGEESNNYITNNVKVNVLEKKHQNRFQRMLKSTSKVYKQALLIDAEVYHFHDPELLPIGNKLRKKGKKVIYDAHEDLPRAIMSKTWIPKPLRKIISYVFEKYENKIAKKMDYVITATPYIEERFLKVNPNTIAINNYPLLNELEKKKSLIKKNQICYLGGLSKIRGLEELIEMSRKIEVPLIIAGPIENQDSKKRIFAEKNIEYLGIINREEAAKLLGESLAGIVTFLPEPNHINAQPNKLFEYMSASLAIIGSDFPLWKNIIEENDAGICVNPLSVEEISGAINHLVSNKEKAIIMGESGRRAVEAKYNWETEEKKLFEIYKEILS